MFGLFRESRAPFPTVVVVEVEPVLSRAVAGLARNASEHSGLVLIGPLFRKVAANAALIRLQPTNSQAPSTWRELPDDEPVSWILDGELSRARFGFRPRDTRRSGAVPQPKTRRD